MRKNEIRRERIILLFGGNRGRRGNTERPAETLEEAYGMRKTDQTMLWHLAAPIDRWDEALPLGNGITGVLLWGDSRRVKLSLDRGDLWDERTEVATNDPDWNRAALEEIVATRDCRRLLRLDELHEKIQATKLPVGRLELVFKSPAGIREFLLDMKTATGRAVGDDGSTLLECFCAADMSGIHLRVADSLEAEGMLAEFLIMSACGSRCQISPVNSFFGFFSVDLLT